MARVIGVCPTGSRGRDEPTAFGLAPESSRRVRGPFREKTLVKEPWSNEVEARCRLGMGRPPPERGSLNSSPIRLRRILLYGIDGFESSVGGFSRNRVSVRDLMLH